MTSRIRRIQEPDSPEAAYGRGLKLLGVRSRGREELRRDLERRGFVAAAARAAVQRLEGEGWLQDLAAAQALVRAKATRYGRARVARELSARGFGAETARRALAELPDAREGEALLRAFRRLWKSAGGRPLTQRRQRVRRALLARGFAPDAISAMIRGSHEVAAGSDEIS